MILRTVTALCITLGLAACTTRHVAPPAAPSRGALELIAPPRAPAENEGAVTLDAEPAARVELIVRRTQPDPAASTWTSQGRGWGAIPPQSQLDLRPLCHTPCAVVLPRGDHELLFTAIDPSTQRNSTASVRVGERPSIARHALGRQTTSVGSAVAAVILGTLGLGLGMMGGAFVGIGETEDGTDLRPSGGILLGVGAAMGIGAWILGEVARPTLQPGSTTAWTP